MPGNNAAVGDVNDDRIRELIILSNNKNVDRIIQTYTRVFVRSGKNFVIKIIERRYPFHRRRYLYISKGKRYRLSTQKLFCLSCFCTCGDHERHFDERYSTRSVVSFCKICGTELCYVSELKPGIGMILERHGKFEKETPKIYSLDEWKQKELVFVKNIERQLKYAGADEYKIRAEIENAYNEQRHIDLEKYNRWKKNVQSNTL